MILSHRLQMTADEYAVIEPLALAYIERCPPKYRWGAILQGILPKLKRGEMVEVESGEFIALSEGIWRHRDSCNADDKAVVGAVLERMLESEQVDIQTIGTWRGHRQES
jgi:hypothetical protein